MAQPRVTDPAPLPGVVHAVYQPIVDLTTSAVVGFEALARWDPARATAGAGPDFDADDTAPALLRDVDWACREAAISGAFDAALDPAMLLFVNVEPRVLGLDVPTAFVETFARARRDLRLVVELTERDLLADPHQLLAFADRIREVGWGLALDDVGVHSESLAALPFLAPDVVKLDISLVHHDPSADQARTLTGVLAYAERTGATLLAEGIETEEHLERARTLGAVLGQGYRFGRPGPLPQTSAPAAPARPLIHVAAPPDTGPGTVVRRSAAARTARRPVLRRLSRQLEQQAANQADPPVLLATFEGVEHLAPAADRYRALATTCRFVGVLGVGMPADPLPGVRGAGIAAEDPLAKEWTVVVVGAHYAAALIARREDDGAADDDEFTFVLTHDRETVIAAGRNLLRRFGARPA